MSEIKAITRRVIWSLNALSRDHTVSNPTQSKKIEQEANDLQKSLNDNIAITPEELIGFIENYEMKSLSVIELAQLRKLIEE